MSNRGVCATRRLTVCCRRYCLRDRQLLALYSGGPRCRSVGAGTAIATQSSVATPWLPEARCPLLVTPLLRQVV